MRGFKTPAIVAGAARMLRAGWTGTVVIVEGESDSRFWRSRIDPEQCRVEIGEGRGNVEGAIRILEDQSLRGALGFIDADFDRVVGREPPSPNLIPTDTHDLETMLLRSPALEKVLAELAVPRKVEHFERRAGMSVRDALLERGLPLARLRWLSQSEGLRLRFNGLSFERFIDPANWRLDEPAMIAAVLQRSERGESKAEPLQRRLAAVEGGDPWQMCVGHDLVEILALGLRGALGSDLVSPDTVEQHLRLAYEERWLKHTQLYRQIRSWEEHNPPWRVL